VLDEPTNDLDVETLELLEELLSDYPGTLILVSHDRAFLDNVVTQVIALDGQGGVIENVGGFDDFRRWRDGPDGRTFRMNIAQAAADARKREAQLDGADSAAEAADPGLAAGQDAALLAPAAAPTTRAPDEKPAAAPRATPPKPAIAPAPKVKLSFKEQRELDGLPARIETLEREQAEVAARLAQPETYQGDPAEVKRLTDRAEALEIELLEAMERWDSLENKQRGVPV
jgi:ATP-binding cassette subfamily F protein uup